jgi:hypothetical protein
MPQADWENLASLLSLGVAVVVAVILSVGIIPGRWLHHAQTRFKQLAAARSLCYVLIPALSIGINIGIASHRGIPRPIIHDEFSYLLAGDTFAHGRLTNPPPPFPEHFETPQEIVRPTRMSKYPPGQGLAIALGQVTAGLPIMGIWISTAAACAAIYWMLLGFVSKPWALLGGLLATTSPVLLDWSQNYWGGCVAVLGGALLLGGWGRLMLRGSVLASVMMGLGLGVLANSRPFEGLLASMPLLLGLLLASLKKQTSNAQMTQEPPRASPLGSRTLDVGRWKLRAGSRTTFPPAAVVLGLTACWMGYYNYRITGNALRMPFAEYTAQYDLYPKFWFQPLRPRPIYHNATQEWLHTDFEKGQYRQLRTLRGFFGIAPLRAGALLDSHLRLAALFIPFFAAFFLLRDTRIRWVFASILFELIGLLAENFDYPHYSAPITPMILLLSVVGLRWLWTLPLAASRTQTLGSPEVFSDKLQYESRTSIREAASGNAFLRRVLRNLIPAVIVGYFAGAIMCISQGLPPDSKIVQQTALVDLYRELQTGRHIIFVNYGPSTAFINGYANEFVYNPADLDDSRILWVRYFGPQQDRTVANYFTGRHIWLLDIQQKLILDRYLEQR